MPFVRFSRDKRGYQQLFLVDSVPGRRGKPARSRVLYYYRTPPGVKVGREPFDAAVRRMLEEQNPGVVFDWPRLASTQPPPDVEPWREKRRAERAARQARAAEEREEGAAIDAADEVDEPTPGAVEVAIAEASVAPAPAEAAIAEEAGTVEAGAAQLPPQAGEPSAADAEANRRRRGRRRRRRGRGGPPHAGPAGEPPDPSKEG